MWFPVNISEINKSTAFILLCWAELFPGEELSEEVPTPIYHRRGVMDSYELLNELKDIASNAEDDERWKTHIPYVVAELQEALKNDNVIKKYYPMVDSTISNLSKEGKDSAYLLHEKITVILDLMKEYHKKVRLLVVESEKNMPKQKKDMLCSLQHLAMRASSEGVHYSRCREIILQNKLSLSPSEITNKIIEISEPTTRKWFCIITLKGNESQIKSFLTKTNFKLLSPKDKPLGQIGKEFIEKTKDNIRICKYIDDKGPFNAILTAIRELRASLDLANFYYNSYPIQITPYACARYESELNLINLTNIYSKATFFRTEETNSGLVLQTLSDISINQLPDELLSSLEQYTMAHSSLDLKVRFINLWIALETLVGRSNKTLSIINKIVEYITPCINTYSIRNQLKYLSICLHKLGYCNFIPDKTGLFRHSSKDNVMPAELLLFLTCEEKNVKDEFCKAIAFHPFLLFRITLLSEKFNTPPDLKKELQSFYEHTEWQLRRIYRNRNLIVHQGVEIKNISYLIEKLDYYFSTAVHCIINQLRRNKGWRVNHCFEYHRIQYEYLLKSLKHKKDDPIEVKVFDLLKNEDCPYKDVSVWR